MDNSKSWHEDDTFWETWGSLMFTPERIANTTDEVDKIVNLLKIEPEAHVLDLGCGVGRHSLELARRGFDVTGVDRTAAYLNQPIEQANQEGLSVEFVQDDMRSFCQPETYDAIINMFTSFSYFEDPQEDRQVVDNAYRSLKQGGQFLVETHGKETLARIFSERNWDEIDGRLFLQERQVTQNWSWMENRWILIDGEKRIESRFSHRLYSATEMVALLKGCGFSQVDTYGSLDGSPYDHKAQRLIAVGIK